MTVWKRLGSGILALAMIVAMNPLTIHAENQTNTEFDDFMMSEFVTMMESDYMTMHFSVSDPAKYGIEKPDVNIGTIYDQDYIISENQKSIDKLHEFDYDSLSDTQKVDYKEYEYELETAIDQAQYMDLEMLFEPGTDVASNIVTNMTEYVLREKEDAQDYITVLKSIPDYLDQAVSLTQDQAAKGIFLTDDQLTEEEDWLDKFVAKTTDNALIAVYNNRLSAAAFLTDTEKAALAAENQTVVLNTVIPAFQKTRDALEKLRGSRKYGDRVYDLPNGAAYYQASMLSAADSTKTVKELLEIALDYSQQCARNLMILESGSNFSSSSTEQVKYTTPEEILSYLKTQLDQEFPSVPSLTYQVEYLDKSVANDNNVAYSLTCPVDDTSANSIKINGDNISDVNTLYQTLAHEGIAGHMYQRNYYISTDPEPIRLVTGYLGYMEGWAMYSQSEMWQYSGLSATAVSYNQLDSNFAYALQSATDLMVNGLGYSDAQVEKVYTNMGLSSTYATAVISYIEKYPGMLVPYGVGLSYIEKLRSDAEDSLQGSFNVKEFNTVLLNNGPRNFNLVADDVAAYISSKNGTVPSDSPVADTSAADSAETSQKPDWMIFGGIGAGLAAVGIIAFIMARRYRKDDPFGA